ncbi:hypothetical protein SGFS_009220 [Streptomyces graminofaciens]|uniref:Uncharacterized protein n=1 Tax=Streptomyces graminofaciens TaxID=68212 RepID=A0ABN5V9Q9_9ACTN|nr:hypothetical protein SGFS_009220 [Streptomyces graminofaciens]
MSGDSAGQKGRRAGVADTEKLSLFCKGRFLHFAVSDGAAGKAYAGGKPYSCPVSSSQRRRRSLPWSLGQVCQWPPRHGKSSFGGPLDRSVSHVRGVYVMALP